MTFEEARNSIDSKYNIVEDLGDAWLFTWEEAQNMIGGDQGYVIMKETGERMLPFMYYMKDAAIDQKYVRNFSKEYSVQAYEEACRFVTENFPEYEEDIEEEDDYIKYKEYSYDTDDKFGLITVCLEKEPEDEFHVYIKATEPLNIKFYRDMANRVVYYANNQDIDVSCDKCDSKEVTIISYGTPGWIVVEDDYEIDPRISALIKERKIVLGGCCVGEDDPKYYCRKCGNKFGKFGKRP